MSRRRAAARLLHRNVDPIGGGNKASAYPVTCTYLSEWGLLAGLRPAPAEATATAEAAATAGYLWDGEVGPVAGDAVNPSLGAWPRHPCRGHSRNRTHPAFDGFPRSVGAALCVAVGRCRPWSTQ
ncbi:hypothetical protein SMD_2010 [Stenotrophomonas maltophilia D457]|nr:hypothetical protein SMD_2010 [Stenotrophomonas maltophilia D457]